MRLIPLLPLTLMLACSEKLEPATLVGTGTPVTQPGTGTSAGSPTDPLPLGLPEGMLIFVDAESCPAGWSEWTPGVGRAIVAVQTGDDVGASVGDRLQTEAPLPHDHGLTAAISLPGAGFSGLSGCCNSNPGASGDRAVVGLTEPASPEIPTVALKVCHLDQGSDDALGHSLPEGVAAFFDREACPEGMARVANSSGRLVVPSTEPSAIGQTLGTPFSPGESRTHLHGATLSVTVPEASLAASGGGNNDTARKGLHQSMATTDLGELGLPYAQALLCEVLLAVPSAGGLDEQLTPGAVVWSTGDCPPGWQEPLSLEGRVAIGKPIDVPSGTSYGDPLSALTQPLHAHDVSLTIDVPSSSVALASGCCFSDNGGHGSFDVSGPTDPASVDLPYIHLRACLAP